MKTLAGVLALVLALMFGASSVVVAAEPIGGPGSGKVGPPSTERKAVEKPAISPPSGQKDPCGDHKNDSKKQADCQKAAKLGRAALSGGGSEAKVSVCSGGYWWTGGWGGWTQGGPCSPEGSIK